MLAIQIFFWVTAVIGIICCMAMLAHMKGRAVWLWTMLQVLLFPAVTLYLCGVQRREVEEVEEDAMDAILESERPITYKEYLELIEKGKIK